MNNVPYNKLLSFIISIVTSYVLIICESGLVSADTFRPIVPENNLPSNVKELEQFTCELFCPSASSISCQTNLSSIAQDSGTITYFVSPWQRFKNKVVYLGWGAVALIFLWQLLKVWIKKWFYFMTRWLYSRVGGKCIARSVALRTYNSVIIKKYEKIKIPFRPYHDLKMKDIFVPLLLKDIQSGEEVNAFEAIRKHDIIVVTGSAGSGKSMLLKNCALLCAEGCPEMPEGSTALILKLHHFGKSDLSLEEYMTDEFKRNDFPHAQGFIQKSLAQEQLILLLDGFDEVHINIRHWVVQQIKDFISRYHNCSIIITCRSDVYKREFNNIAKRTFDISPLRDQQIIHFLNSWIGDMPASKSIERLITTLQERPHIIALARNPLMLTLIAYLYTDTPYLLPHNRSEFFLHSTDLLLRQRQHRNNFEARDKRLILQQLALVNQDRADELFSSPRSMDYEIVFEEVNNVLIHLNLNSEYAHSIINEIINHSGLFTEIEGGECFQFAHLTLQEFFSASALLNDEEGLRQRFLSNSELWKGSVKLWCGLADNSTDLIRTVYEHDPLTAFECLCDAQDVNSSLKKEIATACKSSLGKDNKKSLILQAFGSFAAGTGIEEQVVFSFLVESLRQSDNPSLRLCAADALSYTNVQAAARWLALVLYCCDISLTDKHRKHIRFSLRRMGDLAVTVLAPLAEFGELLHSDDTRNVAKLLRSREEIFDDLLDIGTQRAAHALLQFLWYYDDSLAFEAAWRLVALMQDCSIEQSLRTVHFPNETQKTYHIQWVWEPFNETSQSSLSLIVGRIFSLLVKSLPEKINHIKAYLDIRIVVPLIVDLQVHLGFSPLKHKQRKPTPQLINLVKTFSSQSLELQRGNIESDDCTSQVQAIKSAFSNIDNFGKSNNAELQKQFVQELLKVEKFPLSQLIELLKPESRFSVLRSLYNDPGPTYKDWRNIFHPCTYVFYKSFHYRLILLLMGILSLICLFSADTIFVMSPLLLTGFNALVFCGVLTILISWYLLWKGNLTNSFSPGETLTCSLSPFLFLSFFFKLSSEVIKHLFQKSSNSKELEKKVKLSGMNLLRIIPCIGFLPSFIYLITTHLNRYYSWFFIFLWWLSFISIMIYLIRTGLEKERSCSNPLRGLVEKPPWMSGNVIKKQSCRSSRYFPWLSAESGEGKRDT